VKKTLIVFLAAFFSAQFSSNIKAEDKNWYKCFKGKAGGQAVTMHLCMLEGLVEGYYYEDKVMLPMFIIGEFNGDSLNLTIIEGYSINYIKFNGVCKNEVYSGEMELGYTHKKLKFNVKNKPGISEMFKYESVSGKELMFEDMDEDSPLVRYQEGCIWPSYKYPEVTFLRNEICKQLGFPWNAVTIHDNLLENKRKFISEYMQAYGHLTRESLLLDTLYLKEYTYNHYDDHRLNIVYFDENLFITSKFFSNYRGYHEPVFSNVYVPDNGETYTVYDLQNKEQLELTDIITDEGIKNLPEILAQKFYEQTDVSGDVPLKYLGIRNGIITPSENFVFTPGCVMFYYADNEMGEKSASRRARLYVPVSEIKGYLTQKAKELIM
jgi:hypothetical protein